MKIPSLLLNAIYGLLLTVTPGLNAVFAQDETAGEDKTICNSGSVTLGDGTENPTHCYSWKPEAGLSNPHILHPVASPAETTTYTLTVVGDNFSFKNVTPTTVFVGEGKVTLTIENNLTECMAERHVTFTAIASDAFPDGEPLMFTFHFHHPNGEEWTKDVPSMNRTANCEMAFDNVPPGSADHHYPTQTFVEVVKDACKATSDPVNTEVYELWIEYVRDDNANNLWKVVVGEAIAYSAIASSDCSNWKWEFPDGKWSSNGGHAKTGNDLVIPYSTLGNASNADFGETYGTVKVSCTDGAGNEYVVSSTSQNPSKKVQVFFDPDRNLWGDYLTTSDKPPCWFVFWKDGQVVQDINRFAYKESDDYGGFDPDGGLELGSLAATINSGPELLFNMYGLPFFMTGTGHHLKCVAETITHELYHEECYNAWGNYGLIRPGHLDTDGLPDAEEESPGFDYFQKSNKLTDDTFGFTLYAESGYADQEVRCRITEIITERLRKWFPEKDWSKTSENPKWMNF